MALPLLEILKRDNTVIVRTFSEPVTVEISGPGYEEMLPNAYEHQIPLDQYNQALQIVVTPTPLLKEVQA